MIVKNLENNQTVALKDAIWLERGEYSNLLENAQMSVTGALILQITPKFVNLPITIQNATSNSGLINQITANTFLQWCNYQSGDLAALQSGTYTPPRIQVSLEYPNDARVFVCNFIYEKPFSYKAAAKDDVESVTDNLYSFSLKLRTIE